MDINPSYTTIGKIFEQNYIFSIPKYQRYYAWEDEQVDDYIRDISALIGHSDYDHFFGGIVCVEKSVSGSRRSQREVVDGQQRLTTTMLLVIAIYNEYLKLDGEIEESDIENKTLVKSRIDKLNKRYINYDDEINRKPVVVRHLTVSKADEECYEAIISRRTIPIERESHKRMKKAYEKLVSFVCKRMLGAETIADKLNALADVEDTLDTGCTIIFIDTKTTKDAYTLFQVLNDRGMGLTVGDLLKSKTLELIDADETLAERLVNEWDEILSGNSKAVDDFLKYFYMSKIGKRAGASSLFDDYLKNIFKIESEGREYTDEEKARIPQIVGELKDESLKFKQLYAGDWPYEVNQPITGWDRNRLKNLIVYLDYDITLALLLAATKLDHRKFSKIVQKLEIFMFRYKGICNNNHQKLADFFMTQAVSIRNSPDAYDINTIINKLHELILSEAGDELFKQRLKGLKYSKTAGNKMLKYMFATLTEYASNYANGGLIRPEKGTIINYENVSIEHIYSQHPADGSDPDFDLNELSNLTLLTLSENGEQVRNKPYAEKKPIYLISEYKLNKKFNEYDEWNKENRLKWLDYITEMCCKVFNV